MNKIFTTTALVAALATALALSCTSALAANGSQTAQPPVGERTQNLLQVQRDGSQASPHSQHLSAEAAKLGYQRWLNSFKQPIPDSFSSGQAATGSSSKR